MSPHHFAQALLDWFSVHGRDLPWRHTRNPYAIWLSEIILQQTRISQGMAYWERFMEAYPTVDDLAAASEDEVLKLWQGLGYYSRARNLHKAARQIVALGRFPARPDDIKKLKGVGDYTAAAIASFAFGIPAAAVDGNFFRVLSRVYGIDTPINSTKGVRLFRELAEEIVGLYAVPSGPSPNLSPAEEENLETGGPCPSLAGKGMGKSFFRRFEERRFGRFGENLSASAAINAAMMDFGATQCTPKSPACEACPFGNCCAARRQGLIERLPVKLKTVKLKTLKLAYIYIRCNGYTAIRRRGEGDIWQGLWEPYVVGETPGTLEKAPALVVLRRNVKHVLTHRVILADFFLLETGSRPVLPEDYIWVREVDIDSYAVPRLIEIMLEEVADRG